MFSQIKQNPSIGIVRFDCQHLRKKNLFDDGFVGDVVVVGGGGGNLFWEDLFVVNVLLQPIAMYYLLPSSMSIRNAIQ